jgi:hypothetical protein
VAALPAEEQVFDLANDPRAVQRTLDSGGVRERALRRLQDRLHIVKAEDILLDKELERRHGDCSADHGRSKRAAEGGVRHDGAPKKRPVAILEQCRLVLEGAMDKQIARERFPARAGGAFALIAVK